MPKSSMTIATPSAFNRRRIERVRGGSLIRTPSVISSSSLEGASPVSNRIAWTKATRSPCWNWIGERLTAIFRGEAQEAASRQAARRTHSPMEPIRPFCSASEMKVWGSTRPSLGKDVLRRRRSCVLK